LQLGYNKGLNYDLIEPTNIVNPTEPTLQSRISSLGNPLWSADDGVHLAWEGYRDLAATIGEVAESEDVANSLSCSSEGSKRNHPDSIVTLPHASLPKRERSSNTPPITGWLHRVAEPGRHEGTRKGSYGRVAMDPRY
jgi:hypothetical protein